MSLLSAYLKSHADAFGDASLKFVISLYGIWNLDFYRVNDFSLCLHPRISALQVVCLITQ